MRLFLLSCLFSTLCFSALSQEEEIQVNLKEPVFSNGVLKTNAGGILTAPGIRIQAQNIEYSNKTEEGQKTTTLIAEGDLLLEYEGKLFVGSKLTYNFTTHTGSLTDGRTVEGFWFVGGDKIDLEPNGGYLIYNAFITTCENQEPFWKIQSHRVHISNDYLLSASKIRLDFFDLPVFWVPSFKSNLKMLADPPIRYKVVWDKGLGPRATVRYRVFSWEDFNLFTRLDYRLMKGLGAGLESEYFSKDARTVFVTRSYGAYDKVVYDEHGLKRYRLQGLLTHESEDQKTFTHLTYDKFRDLKMLSDFPSTDFEIDTQKRTRLLIQHQETMAFGTLLIQPRINPFDSINQQLPLIKAGVKPFELGPTGIISENSISAGYLDYIYAHELVHAYPVLHETHAARLETKNRIYRPFSAGPIHFTPNLGIAAIFYNNNPAGNGAGQGVLTYGGDLHSLLYRDYTKYKHFLKPYFEYKGLSRPKASLNQHYTFSIDDGLYQLNSLKMGLSNSLYLKNTTFFSPSLDLDLYTYAFFNDKTFSKTCPKGYLSLTLSDLSYLLNAQTCWNFQENLLDFCNLRSDVTVNEHIAFVLEFRHRSRFDWRKADHENFILDMARSIPELENSGLSDKRNTFLSKLQFKISPKWSCHFSSHYGWGRLFEPSYHSFKIDLLTLLASHWGLKCSYLHTTNDDRVSVQMQIVK